jgi:hypothetical protein
MITSSPCFQFTGAVTLYLAARPVLWNAAAKNSSS